MSRLGGPEIKLPEMKAPAFVSDLFYDLKDRHLLPLVALLVVAIVAVPVLLSESSKEPTAADLAAEGLAALSAGPDSGVVVANAAPGLRSYQHRLSDLQATDPFKQHFATPANPEGESPTTESGETAVTETSAEIVETPGGGSTPSGGGTTTVVRTETKYASYEIDARIVTVAASPEGESTAIVRRNLPELSMLPGRETPAVVFMGVSADAKKAMMLVSSDVQSVFGDALCVIGSETCQLLAMEPGLPETFVYGGAGRTYRIEVLKIEKIVSKHPQRARLGAPKRGKSKQGSSSPSS
jgi:hypothetical protein